MAYTWPLAHCFLCACEGSTLTHLTCRGGGKALDEQQVSYQIPILLHLNIYQPLQGEINHVSLRFSQEEAGPFEAPHLAIFLYPTTCKILS